MKSAGDPIGPAAMQAPAHAGSFSSLEAGENGYNKLGYQDGTVRDSGNGSTL